MTDPGAGAASEAEDGTLPSMGSEATPAESGGVLS